LGPNNLHCEDKLFNLTQFITDVVNDFHEASSMKSFELLILVTISCLLVGQCTIITLNTNSLSYALVFSLSKSSDAKKAGINQTTSSHATSIHAVRITSPVKGEKVSVGQNLLISGISGPPSSNSTYTPISNYNCHVSVIANGLKPYHNATAAGPKGSNDYSKWDFSLTSKYTAIKEGANKITAKYSCGNRPSLVSFYSVNVTGVKGGAGLATSTNSSHPVTSSATSNASANKVPGMITPH
jgi:hypothetical protein